MNKFLYCGRGGTSFPAQQCTASAAPRAPKADHLHRNKQNCVRVCQRLSEIVDSMTRGDKTGRLFGIEIPVLGAIQKDTGVTVSTNRGKPLVDKLKTSVGSCFILFYSAYS